MKLKIVREQILQPLQFAADLAKGGGGEAGNNIYRHVALVVGEDGSLRIVGSDGRVEVGGDASLVEHEGGGSICLGSKLLDLCKTLAAETTISLEVADNSTVVLRAGRGRYTLKSLPGEQFAMLEAAPSAVSVKVKSDLLLHMLNQVRYVIPQDDVRFYLNGVLLEVSPGKLRMVATDGHRLALCTCDVPDVGSDLKDPEKPFDALVPRTAVEGMARVLGNMDEEVEVIMDNNSLQLRTSQERLSCKLIDGNFPSYRGVIPQKISKLLKVNAEAFDKALERADIIQTDARIGAGVRLKLSADSLALEATNREEERAEDELVAEYSGEEMEVAFNIKYLRDMLKTVSTEKVCLGFAEDADVAVITADTEESEKETKYILMPLRT